MSNSDQYAAKRRSHARRNLDCADAAQCSRKNAEDAEICEPTDRTVYRSSPDHATELKLREPIERTARRLSPHYADKRNLREPTHHTAHCSSPYHATERKLREPIELTEHRSNPHYADGRELRQPTDRTVYRSSPQHATELKLREHIECTARCSSPHYADKRNLREPTHHTAHCSSPYHDTERKLREPIELTEHRSNPHYADGRELRQPTDRTTYHSNPQHATERKLREPTERTTLRSIRICDDDANTSETSLQQTLCATCLENRARSLKLLVRQFAGDANIVLHPPPSSRTIHMVSMGSPPLSHSAGDADRVLHPPCSSSSIHMVSMGSPPLSHSAGDADRVLHPPCSSSSIHMGHMDSPPPSCNYTCDSPNFKSNSTHRSDLYKKGAQSSSSTDDQRSYKAVAICQPTSRELRKLVRSQCRLSDTCAESLHIIEPSDEESEWHDDEQRTPAWKPQPVPEFETTPRHRDSCLDLPTTSGACNEWTNPLRLSIEDILATEITIPLIQMHQRLQCDYALGDLKMRKEIEEIPEKFIAVLRSLHGPKKQ